MEVAGLILGALPITLSLLNGYKEAYGKVTKWRTLRRDFKKYKSTLDWEITMFRRHLVQLLLPIVNDEIQCKNMVAEPTAAIWRRPDLEDALEDRLGDLKESYHVITEEIRSVVSRLDQELRLLHRDMRAQLKFIALDGDTDVGNLISELKEYRGRLHQLVDELDKAANAGKKRTSAETVSTLDSAFCSLWKRAAALYNIIQAAWSSCSCSKEHITKLLLQHQTKAANAKFEILFAASNKTSAWQLRRALVTIGEDKSRGTSGSSSALLSSPNLTLVPSVASELSARDSGDHQPSHRSTFAHRSSMRKRDAAVTFSDVGLTHQRSPGHSTLESLAKATVQSVPASVSVRKATTVVVQEATGQDEAIVNLCTSFDKTTASDCAGFLHDDSGNSRYYIYPQCKEMTAQFKSVSLEQLIRNEVVPELRYRQTLFLSMTLASAFLQLLDSPWIPHEWTEADILFFPDPDDPDEFLMQKPHLQSGPPAADGEKPKAACPPGGQERQKPLSRDEKRHAALYRLEIMLEELFFQRHIKTKIKSLGLREAQTPKDKSNNEILASVKWLRDISEDDPSGKQFREAVNWCLTGCHNSSSSCGSSSADAWRRDMQQHVVGPLEKEYRNYTSV